MGPREFALAASLAIALVSARSAAEAAAPFSAPKRGADEAPARQGKWVVEKAEFRLHPGEPMKSALEKLAGRKAVVKGGRLTLPGFGDEEAEFIFEVGPAGKPAAIDLYLDGKLAGLGIYSLDGDRLTLAYEQARRFVLYGEATPREGKYFPDVREEPGERPESFGTAQGFVLYFKRAK